MFLNFRVGGIYLNVRNSRESREISSSDDFLNQK